MPVHEGDIERIESKVDEHYRALDQRLLTLSAQHRAGFLSLEERFNALQGVVTENTAETLDTNERVQGLDDRVVSVDGRLAKIETMLSDLFAFVRRRLNGKGD